MPSREISTLAALRRRCRISQEELGDLVGRLQPDISMYENGLNMPDPTAEAILRELRSIDPSLTWVEADDLQKPWSEVLMRGAATR